MNERLKPFEEKMKKTIGNLDGELSAIRAGRANPNVLNKIMVDYYGTPTPIQQVANVSVPEARMIQIQPWEKKMVREIEKAIMTSDLGINPTNDGTTVRLLFPELTEDRRKELVKDVKKKGEAAKVAIRNIRRDGIDSVKKLKGSDVSEDEMKDMEDDLQKQRLELHEKIFTNLMEKNERWYDAIVLVYYMEMPQAKAAELMGIRLEVLHSLLHRAKKWIKKKYGTEYEEMNRED